ncbi:DNA-binding transcriptional regulator, LysR family [Microbacterium hydrothermale]|uniref:LysR family transcriptional regulator n=1 Tax=Microbacterium hydrothermale TaxID=857427 RepID=UPI0022265F49|nr:LysR family transcriptional regulator [Microbacterium hydrothermale]MCW2163143.1 DNA-binding transcriptional regulator, LysR family [Microbacterium hydrothermale]
MTIAQLRAFLTALERGSFTAAAVHLDSTQASVSELVARLERELGVRLFQRGGRRLVPTDSALALRPHAERAVGAIHHGVQAMRALTALESGTCTFGVLRNAAYYDLSDLLQRFHKRHPGVRVRLVGINSALVARSIAAGEVEAGLLVLPVDDEGLSITPLVRDEVVFASARADAPTHPVTMSEVAAAKLVLYDAYAGWDDPTRRQLRERASAQGFVLEPAIEVENVETALGLVSSGTADTIVARSIADSPAFPPGIRVVPFTEPLYDTIALAKREGAELSPAAGRLADMARDMLHARAGRTAGE